MSLEKFLLNSTGKSYFLPAHGKGKALPEKFKGLLRKKPGVWDLPELPGLGGPLIRDGVVARSQDLSALESGAENCWYGVNGATGLLQAALFSVARPKQFVLMPRNVHRSVIQACILGEINPILYDLPFDEELGHYLPPDVNCLSNAFKKIKTKGIDIVAVILLNPTYQGYSSNLKSLIKEIHKYDLPVLVDEAHGTYFCIDFPGKLPDSALSAGADLVINSLHKSAQGLAQTAVLWSQGMRVDPVSIERSLLLIQTTSPSSLLLASCESALRVLRSKKGQRKIKNRIDNALKFREKLIKKGIPLVNNHDPLRLILNTAKIGVSGFEADEFFISNGVIAELPDPGCLTFCLGFAPHTDFVYSLESVFKKLLNFYKERPPLPIFIKPPLKSLRVPAISISNAWKLDHKKVELINSVGEVSADFICPYPPGIPIIIPGEKLDSEIVSWLISHHSKWPSQIPNYIRVVS